MESSLKSSPLKSKSGLRSATRTIQVSFCFKCSHKLGAHIIQSRSRIQPICDASSESESGHVSTSHHISSPNSSQQLKSKPRLQVCSPKVSKAPSWIRGSYLSLDVHDNHCAGPVTHHKVLRVLGHQNNIVNGDVRTFGNVRRFDGDGAFCRVHVPDLSKTESALLPQRRGDERHVSVHQSLYANEMQIYLHCAICWGANGKLAVVWEDDVVYAGSVTLELLQHLSWFQSMKSDGFKQWLAYQNPRCLNSPLHLEIKTYSSAFGASVAFMRCVMRHANPIQPEWGAFVCQ